MLLLSYKDPILDIKFFDRSARNILGQYSKKVKFIVLGRHVYVFSEHAIDQI